MLKEWSIIKTIQAGFATVEILLAAALFSLITAGLFADMVYGRNTTFTAGDHIRAAILAEEGVEASRDIRNSAYANLTNGNHGLSNSSGAWAFSGTQDVTGIFTRQVNVADNGPRRKLITVTITWPESTSGTESFVVTSQLANWRV